MAKTIRYSKLIVILSLHSLLVSEIIKVTQLVDCGPSGWAKAV